MPLTPQDLRVMASTGASQLALDTGISPANRELLSRILIGRAYYAVYHHALNIAKNLGFSFKKLNKARLRNGAPPLSSHEAVWWWYENERQAAIKQRAEALKALRVEADYKIQKDLDPDALETSVSEMDKLFDLLDGFYLDRLASAPVASSD